LPVAAADRHDPPVEASIDREDVLAIMISLMELDSNLERALAILEGGDGEEAEEE
jgi:hypothetical protein